MAETHIPEGFLDIFSVAKLPSLHPGVFIERGGKAIHPTEEHGFFCFGQYKKGYPTIPLQAIFSILIDNNTKDDRNIFILDVYDHHSDRVIGKRVITRKDFAKANEFCLFTFDFTPPSQQANMEFRIYYMGHAYVLADKIAVIDPAKISITQASEIPDLDIVIEPDTVTEKSELPDPWKIAKIGNGDGKVSQYKITKAEIDTRKGVLEHSVDFTVEATGSIQGDRDDFYFIYLKWSPESGNGTLGATFTRQDGFVGIMFRETLEPDSPFIMVEEDRIFYRKRPGGGINEEALPHPGGDICGIRSVRKKQGAEQIFICGASASLSGGFTRQKTIEFRMSQEIYAGLAVATATATVGLGVKYKDKV